MDVWSLGVLCYILLCGIDPFHGDSWETERKRVTGQVDFDLSDVAPSPPARAFIRRLLHPNPVERPTAASALYDGWMLIADKDLNTVSLELAFEGVVHY